MLKRYQVLLNDWLADFLKAISEKYDLSFSEVLRLFVCLQLCIVASIAYPEYKHKFTKQQLAEMIKKRNKAKGWDPEAMHKLCSEIYFEARKAAEHWFVQEKKRKIKKK